MFIDPSGATSQDSPGWQSISGCALLVVAESALAGVMTMAVLTIFEVAEWLGHGVRLSP